MMLLPVVVMVVLMMAVVVVVARSNLRITPEENAAGPERKATGRR